MDESTDISDISQPLVFIRGVDSSFNVTQELAAMQSRHGTTKGLDLIAELKTVMGKYKLDFQNSVVLQWMEAEICPVTRLD